MLSIIKTESPQSLIKKVLSLTVIKHFSLTVSIKALTIQTKCLLIPYHLGEPLLLSSCKGTWKKATVFTNPCLTSKWEASDRCIFLVFLGPSSLLSFIFSSISVPVIHYLCQPQSTLCNSLAPRFRICRSWHAEHVYLRWLAEWSSITNSWCEVFLICLKKNNSSTYLLGGVPATSLSLGCIKFFLTAFVLVFEIHSCRTSSAHMESHKHPFGWWSLQHWNLHSLIQWPKWTCLITFLGVSGLN